LLFLLREEKEEDFPENELLGEEKGLLPGLFPIVSDLEEGLLPGLFPVVSDLEEAPDHWGV
jgi:hypothetical protein